jgi:signal peptidase I
MDQGIEKISRDLQESLKKILRDYAEALFFAVLLALLLRSFVLASYRVTSSSMSPSLIPGDFILGFKLPYGLKLPFTESTVGEPRVKLGELAVFKCRYNGRVSSCVKRVMGLSGDRIDVRGGQFFRNGILIKKFDSDEANFNTLVVPPRHAFVASDQWGGEHDSFSLGAIPISDFEARAEIIWFSKPKGSGVQWQRLGRRIH